jgi:peptidyl-prolyl cis-trans isomerase B (cyclophilin B)
MSSLITKCQKGDEKAFLELYNQNKTRAKYICFTLLANEKEAEKVAVAAFKNAFQMVMFNKIYDEREFSNYVTEKCVEYSREKVTKANPKAFRLPSNFNFLTVNFEKGKVKKAETTAQTVLFGLPEIYRFAIVLKEEKIYSDNRISEMLYLGGDKFKMLLSAMDGIIEKLLIAAKDNVITAKQFLSDIKDLDATKNLSLESETQISAAADELCAASKKKFKNRIITVVGIVVAVGAIVGGILALVMQGGNNTDFTSSTTSGSNTANNSSVATNPSSQAASSKATLDPNKTYYADIDIKDYGTVTVKLDQNSAPVTASNFVELAQSGFYDGLTFHRIIEGFMMQGGDPTGTGLSGSGTNIIGEFPANGYENNLPHTAGAISMARSRDYNSASSQFFIVHKESQHLNGAYAVFGYVTEGMEHVNAVCENAIVVDNNGTVPAANQPIMNSVKIRIE